MVLGYPGVGVGRSRGETCGTPDCAIRNCAKDRGVTACGFCSEYPCAKLKTLFKSGPTLLFDGYRIKEIGMDAWIEEQEARRKNGFCYGDIRCGERA